MVRLLGLSNTGSSCGRYVAKLYQRGKLFACRLATASLMPANKNPPTNAASTALKRSVDAWAGASNMFEDFPDKPKGMHWRTYDRLRGRYDMAEARSMAGLEHFLNRLDPTPY